MKLTNEQEVLRLFFDYPTKSFHIRQIARRLRLNPNTILNIVDKLSNEGLLVKNKKRHLVEVVANVKSKFIQFKRINNIKRIYESGIIEFLTDMEKTNRK